jgi:hypothetical protein
LLSRERRAGFLALRRAGFAAFGWLEGFAGAALFAAAGMVFFMAAL